MKDFIASEMYDKDWKDICYENLPEGSREEISNNNKKSYECSYAVIRKLTEIEGLTYWHEMEKILKPLRMDIVAKFDSKFLVPIVGKQTIFINT